MPSREGGLAAGGRRAEALLPAPALSLQARRPSAHPAASLSLTSALVSGESSSGVSREDYIGLVAKDIENKMPKVFNLDQVRKHLGTGISPTSVVLLQELERFNKLVVRMSRSLAELQRVSVCPTGRALPRRGASLVF